MYIGVYGNYETWRRMQQECDRYGDQAGQWTKYVSEVTVRSDNNNKQSATHAQPTTDAG